jgi:hypothetical protein
MLLGTPSRGKRPSELKIKRGETPSSARRRRGKYHHPAPRGCRFAAPRGAPPLTERLQRPRDPGPASAQGAPGIPRMRLALSKSICGPQGCALGMAGAPCFKYADARCTWHSKGAPGISRCSCNFHGRTGRYRGAPAVHGCTLWEWQVRLVSNKRMPGAPGNLQVHLGISRCAWYLQVHLMRTLLVKARLSGRY